METSAQAIRPNSRLSDYLALTKPSILLLVLLTGLPALLIASGPTLRPGLALATLVGTALASAGAAAINHYMDRDIDLMMARTRGRPLPAGRMDPRNALWFGLVLSALATFVLLTWTTPLATVIAVAGILYYTAFYTGWLKRRTPQNIVIGGAAGATAPLIAWAAMTGRVDAPAWVMFAIVFLWTPPHFWALALWRKDDYAAAGIPMLPVVAGEWETRKQIMIYTLILVPSTLALYFMKDAGILYAVSAVMLGFFFIRGSYLVLREASIKNCMSLFRYSIIYLMLLFVALSADILVRSGIGI